MYLTRIDTAENMELFRMLDRELLQVNASFAALSRETFITFVKLPQVMPFNL